jgi:hypothetical protein
MRGLIWVGALAALILVTGMAMSRRVIALGDQASTYAIKVATIVGYRSGLEISPTLAPSITSSSELTRAIGINVHLTYDMSPYRNTGAVIDAMRYLGVTRVRDYAPAGPQPDSRYEAVARSHVGFDLFVPDTPARLDGATILERRYPGSVLALEGPNEINNFPVSYRGQTGRAGAEALQRALFQTARANPVLAHKPVYMFTGFPAGDFADVANLHAYAHRGDNPVETLLIALEQTTRGQPHQPFVITETGYFTAPPETGWGGVTRSDQAHLLLEQLLDAFRLGAQAVYFYELLDGDRDGVAIDQEHHFGLFDTSYRPKPAATALRNLILALQRSPKSNGVLADPIVQSPGVQSLLLRDGTGAYRLILWRGVRETRHADPVSVDLGRSSASVSVFHPVDGEAPAFERPGNSQLSVDVSNGPAILEVAAAPPSGGPKHVRQ